MHKLKRHQMILQVVRFAGQLDISRLQGKLSVGKETLRKDLAELETLGLITRSYGRVSKADDERIQAYLTENGLLNKKERQDAIRNRLMQKSEIRVTALAEEFSVTTATIRNDIKELKRNSNILKNHGTILFDFDNPVRMEAGFQSISLNHRELCIATRILALLKPGDSIFLGGNRIGKYIAGTLSEDSQSTIVTDSYEIMAILVQRRFAGDSFILPGILDATSRQIRLQQPQCVLSQMSINVAVCVLSGYVPDRGFFVGSFTEKENLSAVLEYADEAVLCITSEEIGKTGNVAFPLDHYSHRHLEMLTDDTEFSVPDSSLDQLGILITYCGKNYVRRKSNRSLYKIGFLHSVSNSYYAKTVVESIESAVNDHEELSLVEMPVDDEVSKVLETIESINRERVDLLVVYVGNLEIGQLIAERCHHTRIRLLSIDVPIPNSYFYGTNNSTAADIGAQGCADYINGYWDGRLDRVISIDNRKAGLSVGFRLNGIIHELKSRLNIDESQVVHIDISTMMSLEPEEARTRLQRICGHRNLFLSFNEKTTTRIHPLLEGFPSSVENVLVGHNYNARILALMELPDSPIVGCIAFHPERYGESVIGIIEKIVNGHEVDQVVYSNPEWIPNGFRFPEIRQENV